MKNITSASNPRIKELVSLNTHKGREKSGLFLADGFSLVDEALSSGFSTAAIAVSDRVAGDPRFVALIELAEEAGVDTLLVPDQVFRLFSTRETPQGVAAAVRRPAPPDFARRSPTGTCLLFERVQDPRNLGLILRTALAAGVEYVFTTRNSVDPFHPLAVQTSMGAVFHQPVVGGAEAGRVVEWFREGGGRSFATSPRGGVSPKEIEGGPAMFVFGNEGAGVTDETLAACDATVTIPISEKAESLNVAVAAGILCFHGRIREVAR